MKIAAISPAIQSLEQAPTEEVKKQHFESAFTQQAYQLFGAKHPDLVESIVTLRVLDSDPDAGTGLAAFILSLQGEMLYVPVVFLDNQVEPMDTAYSKSKDRFIPLTPEWVEEVRRNADSPLGEAEKIPDTTPTDVDIRNLVVPPTTGRYSYASAQPTYAEKIAAAGSHPLGQRLCKLAEEIFDPAIWEGFVTEFSRTQGVTPGVALDQGQMDLNILAKMFKSHQKTWTMPQEAAMQAAQGAPGQVPGNAMGGQPQGNMMPPQGMATGMPPGSAPSAAPSPMGQPGSMAPKMAGLFTRAGEVADKAADAAVTSAALGGTGGLLTGVVDDSYTDLGGRAARGAVGATAGGTTGAMLGHYLNARHPGLHGMGDEIGMLLGAGAGGISAARPDPQVVPPLDPNMYRYASDASADLVAMFKHAQAAPKPRTPLLKYLSSASNMTKRAFSEVLKRNPRLLQKVASMYGTEPLLASLRPGAVKTAGFLETSAALKVTDRTSDHKTFGAKSPLAFRGVARRGYFYDDTRKVKNLAVTQQPYKDMHDARESGVFRLFTVKGGTEPALVIPAPIDLENDRAGKEVPIKRNIPNTETVHPELDSMHAPYDKRDIPPDVERSHPLERLCLFGSGKYMLVPKVHGEQVVESSLEGPLAKRVFDETGPKKPVSGRGCFIYKTGIHYQGTRPMILKNISTDSNGVVRGEFEHGWGDRRCFVMDPRAPGGRILRPAGEEFVVIPASWTWVPLTEDARKSDYVLSGTGAIELGLDRMRDEGAEQVSVLNAGNDQVSVNGMATEKVATALENLARVYDISATDAEAILKIAQHDGRCRAWIVPKRTLAKNAHFVKKASPVDQAFSEVMGELGTQLATLQGQLQVLESVQQRAQALAGTDPAAMQQTDPAMGAQPAPNQDPTAGSPQPPAMPPQGAPAPAAPMPPAPQSAMETQGAPGTPPSADPNAVPPQGAAPGMEQPAEPQLPVMATEGPSALEMAQQVNPAFLDQAAALDNEGVFDTAAIMELERAAGRTPGANAVPVSEYTDDLVETVDDLGRTLLMLQLRAPELREQLSDQGYKDLEQQVRNMFQGLGKLVLELSQHAASLNHAQPASIQ